jgi:hypothetical protein
MYIDKLDGRVDHSFYVQMSEQWRVEQAKLMQEIVLHQAADQCYLDGGCAPAGKGFFRSGDDTHHSRNDACGADDPAVDRPVDKCAGRPPVRVAALISIH